LKLVSVTVENFRSITAARKIPLSGLTTLVGPNNEGKSNILRALVFAMGHLTGARPHPIRFRDGRQIRAVNWRARESMRYHWSNDCPLKLQKSGDSASKITLEFEFSDKDISEFYTAVGSRLNGTLPLSLLFNKDSVNVSIAKPGRGGKALNAKATRIAQFLASKIDIQYIPAVRTAGSAVQIVEELVAGELAKIESDPKYQQALADISALQQPVLEALSKSITATMRGFLPNIKKASIVIPEQDRSFALRGISSISLDDGVETDIGVKGDGVQSLAALALMRHSSLSRSEGKEILIALEEPESHLHPAAIHQLRNVLGELSSHSQVILTTHNPIFTNRDDPGQNIIVVKNRAYPARTVKEVRDILGVHLDDNLTSAEVVLIVEGDDDRIALTSILSSTVSLANALKTGRLAIDVLAGAGNLTHRVRLHADNICKVHAFLDDDASGRSALEAARKDGVLTNESANLTMVGGKQEAELEDLYREELYAATIKAECGLDWQSRGTDENKKWSDRVRNILRRAGKPHSDADVMPIKLKVANAAAASGYPCPSTQQNRPDR